LPTRAVTHRDGCEIGAGTGCLSPGHIGYPLVKASWSCHLARSWPERRSWPRVLEHQRLLDQLVGDGVHDGEHPLYTGVDSFGPGCNRCSAKSQTQEGHAMTHSKQTSLGGEVFASFLLLASLVLSAGAPAGG
jgi:hypothetical protein